MQPIIRLAAFVAALTICLPWCPASAQPSVAFQLNPAHDGATVFPEGFNAPLQKIWSRSFPATVGLLPTVSYPIIAGGRVFVTIDDGLTGTKLLALSLTDGRNLWSKRFPSTTRWGGLGYDNGRLFLATGDGLLTALDPATGTSLWRTSIRTTNSYMFNSPPTARDGRVFVGGSGFGGQVFGVNQITGNILWKQKVKGGNASSPTVSTDGVFVSYGCQAYKFDPALGTVRWHYNGPCQGGYGSTAPLYSNRIYSNEAVPFTMYSFDAGTGVPRLAFDRINKPPAFYGGIGYFPTYFKGLVAATAAGGRFLWQFVVPNNGPSMPPIVINGKVLVASYAGNVYMLDGRSGALLGSLTLGPHVTPNSEIGAQMRIGMGAGEGTVVIPADNTLHAFKGTPDTP